MEKATRAISIARTDGPTDIRRARYRSLGLDVSIDFLPAGEYGPRVISGIDHVMQVQVADGQIVEQVNCLNTTEMLRSKLRSYDSRASRKDELDAVWIFNERSGDLKRGSLFDDSRAYVILTSCRGKSKKIRKASEPWFQGVRSGAILQ